MLTLLLLGATVVPPLLDAAEDVHTAQFEASHDPSSCARLHDHQACTQLANSFGQVAWGWTTILRPNAVPRGVRPPPRTARSLRTFLPTPPSRAPPSLS